MGEIIITNSRFTHIPLPGLVINDADKLSITDNYFHRISAGSVTVKSAKEAEVINNVFSLNAIQVVKSNKGSRLYISRNRVIGASQSPECVFTTTVAPVLTSPPPTTDTTTSMTSS